MKERTNTVENYLQMRQWKKFLLALPLKKPRGFVFENANDLFTIRVRATQLNTDPNCDRKFSVTLDLDRKVATITATLKNTNDD